MLISSYSTYIDTTSTQRAQKERNELVKKPSKSFTFAKKQANIQNTAQSTNPAQIDYISQYKVLQTKQELQKQTFSQNNPQMKFTKISSIQNAQVAYGENSKMFSLLVKPKPSLSQTPKTDTTLPLDAQKAQENTMKKIMVNTYVADENYYRITAA